MFDSSSETLDMDARYSVSGYGGIAFYIVGYSTTEEYQGDLLICDDDDCEHLLLDSCYVEGEYETVTNSDMVRAIMVGDDCEHLVDVSDLTKLDDNAYCSECGQIGCTVDVR